MTTAYDDRTHAARPDDEVAVPGAPPAGSETTAAAPAPVAISTDEEPAPEPATAAVATATAATAEIPAETTSTQPVTADAATQSTTWQLALPFGDAADAGATEHDATVAGATEQGATEQGATEQDATAQDATAQDATAQDATAHDATAEIDMWPELADLPAARTGGPVRQRARTRRALAAVALAAAVLYVAVITLVGDRVPGGVRVGGLDIGGRSRADAARMLSAAYADRVRGPIAAIAGDVPLSIDPSAAGLSLSVPKTLDAAGSRSCNPWLRLVSLTVGRDVAPVVVADPVRLQAELSRQARLVDRPAREGDIRFVGLRPVPVLPQPGRQLDVVRSAAAVRSGYLRTARRLPLPIATLAVSSTPAGVDEAVRTVATPAVAAPVRLDVADHRLTLPPAVIAASLRFTADGSGGLSPRLDVDSLRKGLAGGLATVEVPARDAGFEVVGPTVTVRPAAAGLTADVRVLAAALLPVLRQAEPRSVGLALLPTLPGFTTEQANGLGIREVVGTFTTYHPCCAPRVTNIHHIADIVDGAIVRPGETFSLNGYVGERDRSRGFVDAPMISKGEFVDAVGGGVSQFATTMFNAVFFAGLEDVQHQPHSYYIGRYPPGREATVSFPQPDLRWRNDSPYGVLVKTAYGPKSLTVTFWGTKRYEVRAAPSARRRPTPFVTKYVQRPDCEASAGGMGFDIDVARIFLQGGREVRRETFRTRYLPEPHVICGPSPIPLAPPPPPPPVVGPAPPPSPAASPAPSPPPSPRPARSG